MLQPNEVLSKQMHVKPLEEGEYVIYRLIEADQLNPTHIDQESGEKIMKNPRWQSAKQTLVRDFMTGKKVMIANVVGEKTVEKDGKFVTVDIMEPVKFVTDSSVRVTHDDFGTYQYLERHDANLSNPYRDPKKPAKYYRVDAKKKAISENNKNAVLAEALMWITTCDKVEIQAIAKSLPDNHPTKSKLSVDDFDVLKSQLFDLTKEDPITVMKASSNRSAIAKIIVMECEKYNIIIWDDAKRIWFFNDDEMETIMTVEIGKSRLDSLVEEFKTDKGSKFLKRMQTRLKQFLNNAQ